MSLFFCVAYLQNIAQYSIPRFPVSRKKTALVVALAVKAGPWVIRQCLCGTVTWPVWLSLPLGKTHRLMELPQWH